MSRQLVHTAIGFKPVLGLYSVLILLLTRLPQTETYLPLLVQQRVGIRGSIQNGDETSPATTVTSSPCKSIIAIGSTIDHSTKVSISFDASADLNTDEQFVCTLQDGSDVPLDGTLDQMAQLRILLNNGTLVSGESIVDVEQQESDLLDGGDEGDVQMMRARAHSALDHDLTFDHDSSNINVPTSLKLPPGPINIYTPPHSSRRLATYHGPKPVLAVKVIDKNGLQHPDSPKTISDKIFGTYGDSSTMTSQFAACSFDKLQIVPAFLNDDSKQSKKLADVGVLEVQIPISIQTSSQGSVRKEVKMAIEAKLGMGMPGGIDHVMIILEGCYVECGW
jgi:hypothetical protein